MNWGPIIGLALIALVVYIVFWAKRPDEWDREDEDEDDHPY